MQRLVTRVRPLSYFPPGKHIFKIYSNPQIFTGMNLCLKTNFKSKAQRGEVQQIVLEGKSPFEVNQGHTKCLAAESQHISFPLCQPKIASQQSGRAQCREVLLLKGGWSCGVCCVTLGKRVISVLWPSCLMSDESNHIHLNNASLTMPLVS